MDVMLPTSELLKAQRRDTDRLIAAGSRDSVKAAIASAQQQKPTNPENEKEAAMAFIQERGKGNKYSGHRKSMDPHPGTCLLLYGLGNSRELTTQ